jgi:hypothetical protein
MARGLCYFPRQMPPRAVDRELLGKIAGHLQDITNTVSGLVRMADEGPPEGGHVDPLEQIERSFGEIAEQLRGIAMAGKHGRQYRQIEASLGAIAKAVRALSDQE